MILCQAVGRTSPTIDPKVCNKKVAVDDSYNRGWDRAGAWEKGRVDDVTWSCVDYRDAMHELGEKTRRGLGVTRNREREFSARFGKIEGALELRPDGQGDCRMMTFRTGGREKGRAWGMNGAGVCAANNARRETVGIVLGGGASAGDTVTERTNKWYENKQTNRGWPGTAEGKINTAQGMAGAVVFR
ncbi:P44/Msp2 family outer membrane protein [Anaplasma platys]|uniref:P44/Msp2 family outer membrane protein n=1 Tax=Anaplasma platys TaxID=949 RepID=A0A858PZ20_9RICK|nr:hypothetical protein [Anaplasma platys]QJC27845.1 P44/Msp2 family outer membrane protein [Anaplasma platys]